MASIEIGWNRLEQVGTVGKNKGVPTYQVSGPGWNTRKAIMSKSSDGELQLIAEQLDGQSAWSWALATTGLALGAQAAGKSEEQFVETLVQRPRLRNRAGV
jgi:hypothetical protein